ncbi:hypothetical protein GCM10022297_07920 [Lactobacillus hamsteri]|nr:hypothetical protein [Lactobacillus hamsteri]
MKKSSKLAAVLIAGGILLNVQETVKASSEATQVDLKDPKISLDQLQDKLVAVTNNLEKAEENVNKLQNKKNYDQAELDKALKEQINAKKQFNEANKNFETAKKIYEGAKGKSGDEEKVRELEQKKLEYETLREDAGNWELNTQRYRLSHKEEFYQLRIITEYLDNTNAGIKSKTEKLEELNQKLRKLSPDTPNYSKLLEEKDECIKVLEILEKVKEKRQAEFNKFKPVDDEWTRIKNKANNLEIQWQSVKKDYEKVVSELERMKKGENVSQEVIDNFEKEKDNFAKAKDLFNASLTQVAQIEKQINTDKEELDRSIENKNNLLKEKELLLKNIQEQKQEDHSSSENKKDEGIQTKPETSEENTQTDSSKNLDSTIQTDSNETVDNGIQTDPMLPEKPETTEESSQTDIFENTDNMTQTDSTETTDSGIQTDLIISDKSETSDSSTQTDKNDKKFSDNATQTEELPITDEFSILDKIFKDKHQVNQPSYIEIPVYLPVENNSKNSEKKELSAALKDENIQNKPIITVKHKHVALKFNKKHILVKINGKWTKISQSKLFKLIKGDKRKYKLHGIVKINNKKKNIHFYDKNGKKMTKIAKSRKYLLREIKAINGKLMVRVGSQKQWILAKHVLAN